MFFSSRNHRNFSPRRFGALVISGALVASFAGVALANPATATHGGEVYASGLGLAFGLMMLMLARRKTAIHSS